MTYLCDNSRHLICLPYSIENLHKMAKDLGIKRCWFHKDHYDIPKKRIEEIKKKCKLIESTEIVRIVRKGKEEIDYYLDEEHYCGSCKSTDGKCNPVTSMCYHCDADNWIPVVEWEHFLKHG